MNNQELLNGTRLRGRVYTYTIERVLGRGSFGITYLASTSMKGPLGEVTVQVALKEFFCNICGNKFESLPLTAASEEILKTPCSIKFTRLSSFAGMAVVQCVWLNGVKVATVSNGKTVAIETSVRHNTLFVTDQYGVAFKGDYKFVAESGGRVEIRFKRAFL